MNEHTVDVERSPDQRTLELKASEERFRNLIVRNADGIIIVDQEGAISFVNPAAESLFNQPASALMGSLFGFPLVAGETAEIDILRSGGETVVAEMRVVETEWEGRHAFLASLRDITDRKRAEEARAQLIREQAARAEAEKSSRMKDEFRRLVAKREISYSKGYNNVAKLPKARAFPHSTIMRLKMSDLHTMQKVTYRAAGKYYAARGKYFAAFHLYHQSPRLKESADECIPAAEEYGTRLAALLDYALTTGASKVGEREIQRIRKLLQLLKRELQLIESR